MRNPQLGRSWRFVGRFAAQLFLDIIFCGGKVKGVKKTRINSCLTAAFAALILPGLTMVANSQETIRMSNVPTTSAIENLARQSGMNFQIAPNLFVSPNNSNGNGISEPVVDIDWTNITPKDALSRLLKEHGLFMIEDKSTGIAQITSTNQVANVVDANLLGSNTNNLVSEIRFQDVPLDIALDYLVKNHFNIVLDPKLSGYVDPADNKFHSEPSVSIRWENVTPRQAIVALCENYDLVIVKDSTTGVVRIKPKD